MGRPAKISVALLQRAALALVDRAGLAGLSMRALAKELGTAPMTLYNHVSDREALELLVVDAVIGKARWPEESFEHWQDEVKAIATAWWRAVRAHPHVIPLIMTRRSRSPAVLQGAEALLQALARTGRTGDELLQAFRAVTALVMGMAQVELTGPLTLQAEEQVQDTIARFHALPADRFPRLIEAAGAAAGSNPEKEFEAALQLLLRGVS
jgi:AcrR family transcriptional regulator